MTAPRYAVECLSDPVVQLRDQAIVDTMVCVRQTLNARVLNAPSALRCQRLLRELEKAYLLSVSPQRHDDDVPDPPLGNSDTSQDGTTDWITTGEAAKLLALSRRSVQRLAPAFGVVRHGRWVLRRSAVLAHKAIREMEQDDRAA
jgi:hypothetical protein